jgi:hypothetical protein
MRKVSESVSEDWAAVARVINERVRELGWRQRELAERSQVSAAVVREIQRQTVVRRRSPRTLESLSVALGWEPGHLEAVLKGQERRAGTGSQVIIDAAAVWSRLDALELRLGEIAKQITDLRADISVVINRVQR